MNTEKPATLSIKLDSCRNAWPETNISNLCQIADRERHGGPIFAETPGAYR